MTQPGFSPEKFQPKTVYVIYIATTPEKVWQALTDPAQLREWAPFDADGSLGTVGATVKLTTVGAPALHVTETTVTKADAPNVLEYNWGGFDMRWQLVAHSGGTRLTLWTNIDRRFISMGAAGWHICFDVLDRLLSGTPIGRIVGAVKVTTQRRITLAAHILHPMRDILFDEKIAGSFHFTPGQAYEVAGNGNKSAIHWDMVCIQRPDYGGGEVWFDGKQVLTWREPSAKAALTTLPAYKAVSRPTRSLSVIGPMGIPKSVAALSMARGSAPSSRSASAPRGRPAASASSAPLRCERPPRAR